MIIDNSEQGTPEWFAARRGRPTGSNFSKIITSTGKASTSAKAYMNELLAEWLADKTYDSDNKSEWMERGNELEAEARSLYEFRFNVDVEQVGFCSHDTLLCGVSPDGLVGDDGLVEIKCPKHSTHIGYLLAGKLPSGYVPQVQGQLWVTDRKWCDFISYHPDFDPMIIRVERDEKYIASLSAEVTKFCETMLELRGKLKQQQEAA